MYIILIYIIYLLFMIKEMQFIDKGAGVMSILKMFNNAKHKRSNEDTEKKQEVVSYRSEHADGFVRLYRCTSSLGYQLEKYKLLGDTEVFIAKAEPTEKLNIRQIIVFASTEDAAIEKFNKHRGNGKRIGKLESIRSATNIEKEYILNNAMRFFYAI